tara:strand:- start:8077 stop:8376 length:300 start_codon:yes stop_codon:yes gene_type:complete
MENILCDQTSHMIVKFVGVFPEGINRLHDAIKHLNESDLFEGAAEKVELLSSKFSHEHGSYVVEVRIPYKIHRDFRDAKVPQEVVTALFAAINEFQCEA